MKPLFPHDGAELARLDALRKYEDGLYASGLRFAAGVDEVGRGPLAGPVMACAVILPVDARIFGVDDSKKLSAKKREILADEIKRTAVCYGIGLAEPAEIDEVNILQATIRAMRRALEALATAPEAVLADGPMPELMAGVPQISIVHGDSLSQSVAAASIVAKAARDALMISYHAQYPEYGFDAHKGYGTARHIAAIREHGLCPIHRRSFTGGFIGGGDNA
ncbi:MAG: ribonuclease HII [Defluviitaleaceae bacterium]|nr:ribonuclease HII [Defluviitaleaceae bacterium]